MAASLRVQVVKLLLALILAAAWYYQVFVDPRYNLLCLAFAIVALLWWFTSFVRYLFCETKLFKHYEQQSGELVPTPDALRCVFGQSGCENERFTWWTVIHIVVYTIIGYFIPGLYVEIIGISIAIELIEFGMGYSSKLIIDTCANLFGYTIGSFLSRYR